MDIKSLAAKFPPSEQSEEGLVYRKEAITQELLEALAGQEVTVSNTQTSKEVHGRVEGNYIEGSFAVRYEQGITSWSRSYIWFKEIIVHQPVEGAA